MQGNYQKKTIKLLCHMFHIRNNDITVTSMSYPRLILRY